MFFEAAERTGAAKATRDAREIPPTSVSSDCSSSTRRAPRTDRWNSSGTATARNTGPARRNVSGRPPSRARPRARPLLQSLPRSGPAPGRSPRSRQPRCKTSRPSRTTHSAPSAISGTASRHRSQNASASWRGGHRAIPSPPVRKCPCRQKRRVALPSPFPKSNQPPLRLTSGERSPQPPGMINVSSFGAFSIVAVGWKTMPDSVANDRRVNPMIETS